jgi:hypothetical protein
MYLWRSVHTTSWGKEGCLLILLRFIAYSPCLLAGLARKATADLQRRRILGDTSAVELQGKSALHAVLRLPTMSLWRIWRSLLYGPDSGRTRGQPLVGRRRSAGCGNASAAAATGLGASALLRTRGQALVGNAGASRCGHTAVRLLRARAPARNLGRTQRPWASAGLGMATRAVQARLLRRARDARWNRLGERKRRKRLPSYPARPSLGGRVGRSYWCFCCAPLLVSRLRLSCASVAWVWAVARRCGFRPRADSSRRTRGRGQRTIGRRG